MGPPEESTAATGSMPRKKGPSWPAGTRSQSLGTVSAFKPAGAVDDVGPEGREVDRIPFWSYLAITSWPSRKTMRLPSGSTPIGCGLVPEANVICFWKSWVYSAWAAGRQQSAGDECQQCCRRECGGVGPPVPYSPRGTSWRWLNAAAIGGVSRISRAGERIHACRLWVSVVVVVAAWASVVKV